MKKSISIFLLLTSITISCCSSTVPSPTKTKKYFFKEINWEMEIPESWEIDIRADKTDKQFLKFFYIKPADATTNNNIATADLYKYFPKYHQNWLSDRQAKNKDSYNDYKQHFPNFHFDTASGAEIIDGLEFQSFKMKLNNSNGVSFNTIQYYRLFGDYEFTLNLDFADEQIGDEFLKMWRSSKFKRQ